MGAGNKAGRALGAYNQKRPGTTCCGPAAAPGAPHSLASPAVPPEDTAPPSASSALAPGRGSAVPPPGASQPGCCPVQGGSGCSSKAAPTRTAPKSPAVLLSEGARQAPARQPAQHTAVQGHHGTIRSFFAAIPPQNCRGDLSQEGQTPQNQHPGLSDSDLADVLRAPVSLFPSLAMTYGNLPLETESCEPSSSTVANPQPRDKNTHPQIPFSAQRDHRAASFLYTPRNPEPFPKATGISLAADDPQRTGEARRALHGPPRTAAPPRARHLPLPAAVPPSSSRLPKRRVPRG